MKSLTRRNALTFSVLAVASTLAGCSRAGAEKTPGQSVTMDQLPEAVKKTILTQSAGANVRQIDKVQFRGKPVYEAHIDANGATREVRIAEDGKLVSKRASEDDDDDDD